MSVTEEQPAEIEPQPQPTIPQGIKNRHAKKRKHPVDDNQSNVAGSSAPSTEDGELPASPQSKTPTSSVVLDGLRMTPQQAMHQLMVTQAQAQAQAPSTQVDENQPPVLTANVSATGSQEEEQVLQQLSQRIQQYNSGLIAGTGSSSMHQSGQQSRNQSGQRSHKSSSGRGRVTTNNNNASNQKESPHNVTQESGEIFSSDSDVATQNLTIMGSAYADNATRPTAGGEDPM